MNPFAMVIRALAMFCLLGAAGCVTRPPSIAHAHIGHALTGMKVTPGQAGYLLLAEERAAAVRELARKAAAQEDLTRIKSDISAAVDATISENSFGLRHSLVQASNHITFAATSDDASENVRAAAPVFAKDIVRVVQRCELISLLGKDVAASTTLTEAKSLAAEIAQLAEQNVNGEDADRDGVLGGKPSEYGLKQLRSRLEQMIAREQPPYRTVDQIYLFNVVQLPNGKWVYDRFNIGSSIDRNERNK